MQYYIEIKGQGSAAEIVAALQNLALEIKIQIQESGSVSNPDDLSDDVITVEIGEV